MTAANWAAMIVLAVIATGCAQNPASPSAAPPVTSGLTREYLYPGKGARPEYMPDKSLDIHFIDVGRATSSGVGDAVDGGAWMVTLFDGGVVGLADGSTIELKEITVVRNNRTNEVVAVEVP